MWAIEFGEPRRHGRSYRLVERMQPGLFAQLVVAPLFSEHHVLSQVAGHKLAVIKGLPPLTISEQDVAYFADALDRTIARARHLPRSLASFALTAAGVR
jgi:ornithine--oxo-acid transaminase